MGLRTEDISISPPEVSSAPPLSFQVPGRSRVVEPLGSETNLHMNLKGVDLVAKSAGRRLFSVGEELPMTLNLTHLHLFDAESEASIY